MLKSPRRPRYLTLLPFGSARRPQAMTRRFYRDWALKALPDLNREVLVDEHVIVEIYQAALTASRAGGVVQCGGCREPRPTPGVGPAAGAYRVLGSAQEWRCDRCRNAVIDHPTRG